MYVKKRNTTKPRRRRVARKMRVPRSKFGRSTTSASKDNYACSVESYQTLVDIMPNQAYAIAPTLSQFARSIKIASEYQHYRCVSVHTKFEPLYNVFQDASGNVSVPQLFYQMNRSGTQPAVLSLKWFEENGSKPMKLTADKVIKYKPNTLVMGSAPSGGVSSLVGGSSIAWDKWINSYTDASDGTETINYAVPFFGHLFWIDQAITNSSSPVARLVITTKWEFNKPYVVPPSGTDEGASLTVRL